MKVKDLFTYPIKSLGGYRISEAKVLQKGFEFDRRWMLVDDSGKCITQRIEHTLALLETELADNSIIVRQKNHPNPELRFPLKQELQTKIVVELWNDTIESFHLNADADEWFSNYLGKPCKLVFLPEDGIRPVDSKYAINDEQVSFADSFPYLLISEASLTDLNSRLDKPVPMNRFRPNIVISGTEAFAEDQWAEIAIGEVHFKVAKPCARCILTTIDQNTAEKEKEPLQTLSKFRMNNNKVLFGQNLLALNEGTIASNMQVEILSYK